MSREAKGKGKLMSPFQTWDKKKMLALPVIHIWITFMC